MYMPHVLCFCLLQLFIDLQKMPNESDNEYVATKRVATDSPDGVTVSGMTHHCMADCTAG